MTFLPTQSYRALGPDGPAVIALRESLAPFVGERIVGLLAYTVSHGSCAEFYRARLAADDATDPQLTEAEQLLLDWAKVIALDPASVPPSLSSRLEATFSPETRALLVAYMAQVIAATVAVDIAGAPVEAL